MFLGIVKTEEVVLISFLRNTKKKRLYKILRYHLAFLSMGLWSRTWVPSPEEETWGNLFHFLGIAKFAGSQGEVGSSLMVLQGWWYGRALHLEVVKTSRQGKLAIYACVAFLVTVTRQPTQTVCYHIGETKEQKLYKRQPSAVLRAQPLGS